MSAEKEILIDLIEERTILGKPVSLPLRFRYHLETGSLSICKVMEARNDGIKDFYYRLWFGNEKLPLPPAVTDVFDGGSGQVTQ